MGHGYKSVVKILYLLLVYLSNFIAKAAFNKKTPLFNSKLDLNLRKKPVKCYIWSTAVCGTEIWSLREGSELSGKF